MLTKAQTAALWAFASHGGACIPATGKTDPATHRVNRRAADSLVEAGLVVRLHGDTRDWYRLTPRGRLVAAQTRDAAVRAHKEIVT